MRALLDVNVLIALLDADHSLHEVARRWLAANALKGWASCPTTQNGCLRIMAQPTYPNALPVLAIAERLRKACAGPQHEFWPDDLSILDRKLVDPAKIHSPRQITDVYLFALAVKHGGRFVRFDGAIAVNAARGAARPHLTII